MDEQTEKGMNSLAQKVQILAQATNFLKLEWTKKKPMIL